MKSLKKKRRRALCHPYTLGSPTCIPQESVQRHFLQAALSSPILPGEVGDPSHVPDDALGDVYGSTCTALTLYLKT